MAITLDTNLAVDTAVNANTYAYAQSVTFNQFTGAITNATILTGPGSAALGDITITDNPSGAIDTTVVQPPDGGFADNVEFTAETLGLVSTDFSAYLDGLYPSGWTLNYTGYNLAGTGLSERDPIIKVNPTDGGTTYFVLTNNSSPLASSTPVPAQLSPLLYCFEKNTLIATPSGEVPVSELAIGDEVLNCDNNSVKVKWIGRQTINPFFAKLEKSMPIKISVGALGNDLPTADLYVSPGHAILVDGVLVHALALVNGSTITQMQRWSGDVEYFHIETENHELILANGAAAETFIDNVSRKEFDNWAEYEALYPNAAPMIELDLPRVKFARQLPKVISDRLDTVAKFIEPPKIMAA